MKPSLLFLCTGNSCRSQMAEGFGHLHLDDAFDVYSAGIETHGLNPHAVAVMAESGVDITGQQSQTVEDLPVQAFDYVVTVCGHAHENCPFFPATTRVIHHGFDDPPKLAADATTEEARMAPYRRVRDEIEAYIRRLQAELDQF